MKKGNQIRKSTLIDRSISTINDSHLEDIWQAGIRRDPLTYHSTVMYPPLKTMKSITEKQIYSHFNNKCRDFSLYIHIPFCSGKCTFCYFYQIEKPAKALIAEYLSALEDEIKIAGKKITDHVGRIRIKSIFFGGGSPTVLTKAQFEELINALRRQFDISDKIEITVEIHPEIMKCNGRSLLESYFACGINRLNIGVQCFNDDILKTTKRRHTAQEGIDVFDLARKIGFKNINIDLLYPLPDLTPEIWEKNLDIAFGLKPESITTYFTAIRKPSSMYGLLKKHPERFPDEYMNHLFRSMTMEKAKEKGYDHRKLTDWFVKPRKDFHYNHQKNEVKRTEEIQLLSLGSGVFSYVNHFQFYNYPDIRKYCAMLKKGALPVWRGIKLTKEERLARAMVLGIKSGEVDIDDIEKRFTVDLRKKYASLLRDLENLGLLENNAATVRLSEKGMLFADEVAVQFITKNIRKKLSEKTDAPESQQSLIESYNFMYDMNGLSFLQ